MSTLRYTDGPVTVTLSGDLEAFVRRALDAAGGETLRIMEAMGETLATEARGRWYGDIGADGVKKRTGRSGTIEVVTRVSGDEVRVSIGSIDLAKAKYVHRPMPLSTKVEEIDKATYETWKNGSKATLVFHARAARPPDVEAGKYYRVVHNPDASDGKYLLQELIRKPGRALVKATLPDIGRAIARKAGG